MAVKQLSWGSGFLYPVASDISRLVGFKSCHPLHLGHLWNGRDIYVVQICTCGLRLLQLHSFWWIQTLLENWWAEVTVSQKLLLGVEWDWVWINSLNVFTHCSDVRVTRMERRWITYSTVLKRFTFIFHQKVPHTWERSAWIVAFKNIATKALA